MCGLGFFCCCYCLFGFGFCYLSLIPLSFGDRPTLFYVEYSLKSHQSGPSDDFTILILPAHTTALMLLTSRSFLNLSLPSLTFCLQSLATSQILLGPPLLPYLSPPPIIASPLRLDSQRIALYSQQYILFLLLKYAAFLPTSAGHLYAKNAQIWMPRINVSSRWISSSLVDILHLNISSFLAMHV